MTWRQLTRELNSVWLASYGGKVERVDSNGRRTGEWVVSYGAPEKYRCTYSPESGDAAANGFGVYVQCDRSCKIAQTGLGIDPTYVAWVDTTPELNSDGTLKVDANGAPTVPNDYIITMVAESREVTNLSLKRSA